MAERQRDTARDCVHAPRTATAAATAATPRDPSADDPTVLDRVAEWFDERTGLGAFIQGALRKVFPDHWSFLLGEVALFCLVILVATGTFLTLFYTPDQQQVTYEGPYGPLAGVSVSAAFDSVMRLSFEVRAGLVMRQIHHWTALVFLGAIAAHLCRVFFTGAFRRPREVNYLLGLGLLLLGLAEGLTGYSLPDDQLSGTGLRILYSAILSVPVAGPWAASLLFGGTFPTEQILSRLFVFHIMLLPALLLGGAGLHIGIVYLQQHTQYRGGRARESNVVGLPFWPGQVFRSTGLLLLTAGVLALVAGFVQINPVWLYGPYLPYVATVPAQPDWYLGWLEGTLRMGLPIEPTIGPVTIPTPFVPGILIPGALFAALALWPFLEARLTNDHEQHHLLEAPWETPIRTATGAGGVALFLVLTLAGGNDVLAVLLGVPVERLTDGFRLLVVAVPVITWLVVFALARERRNREWGGPLRPDDWAEAPLERESPRATRLVRTPAGGFEEVPE